MYFNEVTSKPIYIDGVQSKEEAEKKINEIIESAKTELNIQDGDDNFEVEIKIKSCYHDKINNIYTIKGSIFLSKRKHIFKRNSSGTTFNASKKTNDDNECR